MIRKLNNKGMTIIEILICFVLVSIIIISMFNVVNNYKDKEEIESYKKDIRTYQNILTETIFDDIIANKGIKEAISLEEKLPNKNEENCFKKTINLKFISGKNASIIVYNDNVDKNYYVTYIDSSGSKENFPLKKVFNLQFNDIIVEQKPNGFINIHIGLWHSDLGVDYDALNLVMPNVDVYPGTI